MKRPTIPIDLVPPYLCRAYAHVAHGGHTRPTRIKELAEKSGLSTRSVKRLSRRTTWAGVRVGVAFRFSQACGVDLMAPTRVLNALRRGRARAHWKQNLPFYSRLMAEVRRSVTPGSR